MDEHLITADSSVWDSIWSDHLRGSFDWDYLSEVILRVLEKEIGVIKGNLILEAGSGSGRISMSLAMRSGNVALLDYSLVALKTSRGLFKKNGLDNASFQGDIRNMPVKNCSCDVVWNAGVLEHYTYEEQAEILKSLIDICKDGGVVITLNPYSKSFIYNAGKKILAIFARWPFGKEYPIRSIYEIYDPKGKGCDIKEYPIGFIVFFVDAYKFLPRTLQHLKITKALSGIFVKSARYLFDLDKFLARLLGGYLIVSVIRKKGRCEKGR